MANMTNPALTTFKTLPGSPPVGICIPVYNTAGNTNLAQAQYTVRQCVDLPYQLSLGVGAQCVAKNRLKAEARLDPSIRYVIHMDDDVLVPPHFASKFVQILQSQDRVGVVSAVMYGPRLEAQNDLHPSRIQPGQVVECLPPGTCFAYDREKTPIAWDGEYLGSQWEDTDAMMQIKALGYKTVATGCVVIMHKNNWSENKFWEENKARFMSKWPGVLK